MKKSVLLILPLLILSSCIKDKDAQFEDYTCNSDCYIVEGFIVEGQTSDSIHNVNLEFKKLYNQHYTDILANKRTNSEGYYRFEMPIDYFETNRGLISVEITKEGYVNSGTYDLIKFDSSDVDTPKQKDYTLYRASKLVVRLHNSPSSNFGSVSVQCDFDLENVPNVGHAMHDSPSFQSTIEFKVPSDLPTKLSWYTYQSTLDISGSTIITVPQDSTQYFDIYL